MVAPGNVGAVTPGKVAGVGKVRNEWITKARVPPAVSSLGAGAPPPKQEKRWDGRRVVKHVPLPRVRPISVEGLEGMPDEIGLAVGSPLAHHADDFNLSHRTTFPAAAQRPASARHKSGGKKNTYLIPTNRPSSSTGNRKPGVMPPD